VMFHVVSCFIELLSFSKDCLIPFLQSRQAIESSMDFFFRVVILLLAGAWWSVGSHFSEALASPETKNHHRVSIVTGANGYVGREVVRTLLQDPGKSSSDIFCLVRAGRVASDTEYWQSCSTADHQDGTIHVLPYDMNDGGKTLEQALQAAQNTKTPCNKLSVYHIASVFGPTEDPIQTARDNVQGTEDLIQTLAKTGNCRLVLTSSMAAVRGTGQDPSNGKYYTHEDWNTISKLNADNWGSCYQWSKAESERRAWELSESLGVPMTSICPSFVFGPPSDTTSNSFSITLVDQWVRGKSPVQSRLCVDIRDCAQAHVAAGTREEAIGKRFLVTAEARVSSQDTAEVLKKVCQDTQLGDSNSIHFDSEFQGGAIPIGQKEVDAADRLEQYLGVSLRSVEET
jgi:nucleoside-diphosphate-sugar epimerase